MLLTKVLLLVCVAFGAQNVAQSNLQMSVGSFSAGGKADVTLTNSAKAPVFYALLSTTIEGRFSGTHGGTVPPNTSPEPRWLAHF